MGEDCVIISQDSYYVANTDLPFEERLRSTTTIPMPWKMTSHRHLEMLRRGETIQVPIYDFEAYARTDRTITVEPRRIVIVEGILVLGNPDLRRLFDLKVFVDTDPDVRILRRLVRDVQERGRNLDSVHNQYLSTVKPMHEAFVEPSKKYADLIVPEGGFNHVALETVAAVLRQYLEDGRNPLARRRG